VAGGNLTVTSRISASEFLEGGLVVEDMKEVAKVIEGAGIEAIHISGGNYGAVEWVIQPCSIERGCFVSMAGEIKKVVSVPVMVAGRINPEKALEALATGKADLVSMGRGLVADPDLPNKLKEGRREDVIPCISCNQGCIGRVLVGDTIRCLMNPRTGREKECAFSPAAKKRKVVVIGGGPAGLTAAATAARRGHQVTLYEESHELGGQFRLAHVPPHKEVFKEGLDYLVREATMSGATIINGFRVDEKNVPSLEGEVAIIALGGEPIIPTIPGVTDEKITLAEAILTGRKKPGNKTAIIGGGLVGCEVASFMLKQYDNQVTVFEMLPDIAQDMMFINKITLLQYFSTKPNLKIVTSAKVSDLSGGVVTYEQEGKQIAGGCFDTIVVAVGYKSRDGVANALAKQFSRVEIVGDCKKARKALEAIDEGFLAGSSV
jgi:NADPH-dependent 2,4-dienoyl-CoA reductase/sulfur reductase-like enzyme